MSFTHLKFVNHPTDEIEKSVDRTGPLPKAPERQGVAADKGWSNSREGYEMIARAAYFKAQENGAANRDDEANWLEAERELKALLNEEFSSQS